MMGSASDTKFADEICHSVQQFGITALKRVASARKSTSSVLKVIAEYAGTGTCFSISSNYKDDFLKDSSESASRRKFFWSLTLGNGF